MTAVSFVNVGNERPLSLLAPPIGVPGAWAVLPKDAPDGMFFVTLIRQGVRYTGNLVVERTAPALFTIDYSSVGPALAISYGGAEPRRNGLTSAAVPERFVSLYATGLNEAKVSDVTVDIAGQTVPAVYAGPQGTPGLDQINFIVPKNAYLGCYVPVTIRVRGIASNTATLSIHSDPFACAHPWGLSYADLKTLDADGYIPTINLNIQTLKSDGDALGEGGIVLSSNLDAAGVARSSGVQIRTLNTSRAKTPLGFRK